MRKIILLFYVIFIQNISRAQFVDTFTDGDFTNNPTWIGDQALFKVNTAFQLQLNSLLEGESSLAVPLTSTSEMEWTCWAKLSFAPSDNNMSRVYLLSDQQDLKTGLNGYYIKLGEGGSSDALELVRQSGTIHTTVCRGTEAFIATPFEISIKVVRNMGGNWAVYADPSGGINYQLQASGTDNTYTNGSYSGVYCKYTSSNSTKFYFDNFYAGPIVNDTDPPEVQSVSILSKTNLRLTFSEPIDESTAIQINNYSVDPGLINPVSAIFDPAAPAIVDLLFEQEFLSDISYNLLVANVKDNAGNLMTTALFQFARHEAKTFDILINEIMADPTPQINLPDAEYIELHNRSTFTVNLKDWELMIGSSKKIFPDYNLQPGSYVILCDDGSRTMLEPYGTVIDFSSFAITNAGATIVLSNNEGSMIHSISYTEDWYQSSTKKEGGWSLELIDPLNPCGESANWIACNNETGGTPGTVNAVNASNPDHYPPTINRIGVIDEVNITVWFSESCDSVKMVDPMNYSIDNGIGNPTKVVLNSPHYTIAYLTLATPLALGTLYTLAATGTITDCVGNAILANTTAKFAIPSAPEANDIVINEMLFDPPTGSVDFLELFNRSSKVLDLKDLVLSNYDTVNQVSINYNEISLDPFLMMPGDYIALSTDSSAVLKFYKSINPKGFINMGQFPTMNNDDGIVALTTKGGVVIDVVSYISSMQYPLLNSFDGVSLERINPNRLSNDITNWHSASTFAGYATPAYKNSQFGLTVIDDSEIGVSPDIFSPDNDGFNDNLEIAYIFGEAGKNITITIYDASGHLVRNLVNHELCGTAGSFSWDGITNDRTKASIGRYIVFVEVFDMDGNVKKIRKGSVLGGKL